MASPRIWSFRFWRVSSARSQLRDTDGSSASVRRRSARLAGLTPPVAAGGASGFGSVKSANRCSARYPTASNRLRTVGRSSGTSATIPGGPSTASFWLSDSSRCRAWPRRSKSGWTPIRWIRVSRSRLAPVITAMGPRSADATMQLLDQTFSSRISRLKSAVDSGA